MNNLTKRQAQIINAIIRYKQNNDGISPTYDELAHMVGLPSASTVKHHIDRLHKAGILDFRGVRNIRIPGGQWIPPQS